MTPDARPTPAPRRVARDRRAAVTPRALTVLAAALVVSLLVAACGGGGKKASAPAGPSGGAVADVNATCTLLSREDVQEAIGAPAREGQGTSGNACRFDVAGAPDQAVLLLKTTDPANPANFDRAVTEMADARALIGVGDKAFVTGKQAYVLKGDTIAIVLVNLQRPAPALADAATKLAQAVAPRI